MKINCSNCNKEYDIAPSRLDLYKKHYCSAQCKYESEKIFNPDMDEFKAMLWKHDIVELSGIYSVSVKTIHKFIRNNDIWFRMRRGHRQKLESGTMTIDEIKAEVIKLYKPK